MVAAGTDRGNEVLAHVGAITGLPMAANCASAEANADGTLRLVRHRWAGSLLEDAVLDASPALLTVAVDAVPAAAAAAPAETSVHGYQPALDEADLRVAATESAERSGECRWPRRGWWSAAGAASAARTGSGCSRSWPGCSAAWWAFPAW